MNGLSLVTVLCLAFARNIVAESEAMVALRLDVECPEEWTYAFNTKCIRFYGNSTMQQALLQCQGSFSDLSISLSSLEMAVVFSRAQSRGLRLDQVWFGHNSDDESRFGGFPVCPDEGDTKGTCVKLLFSGPGSGCRSTVSCDAMVPFFCIGDATLLRISSMGADGH